MTMSYLEMSKEDASEDKNATECEKSELSELSLNRCSPEADSIIFESLKRINSIVTEEVTITNWGAIDRFHDLADAARKQGDIKKLRQALGDLERVVRRQTLEEAPKSLVGFDWDDGHEPLAAIGEKLGLS